jgi:hypothetical protein
MICQACGDTGFVRVHSPEDYGVSFESEGCEACRFGRALTASEEASLELHAAEQELGSPDETHRDSPPGHLPPR